MTGIRSRLIVACTPVLPYLFGRRRVSGPDPEHISYRSFASFNDPDGKAGSCRRSGCRQARISRISALATNTVPFGASCAACILVSCWRNRVVSCRSSPPFSRCAIRRSPLLQFLLQNRAKKLAVFFHSRPCTDSSVRRTIELTVRAKARRHRARQPSCAWNDAGLLHFHGRPRR